MAVNISFWAGEDFQIQDLSGSGLGFYGDTGFAASVRVGNYQGRTFITNGAGTTQGPEVDNVKYLNSASGILGQSGSGIALKAIPNYLATLNVRIASDDGVSFKTQNTTLRIYDRTNPDNPASGVTCRAAEVIHPGLTQVANGSGSTTWTTFTPTATGTVLNLCPSPGISGLYAGNGNNGQWSDTRHDHYVCLSASPDTVGSKSQFGLLIETEYL